MIIPQCQIWSTNGTILYNKTEPYGSYYEYDYEADVSFELPAVVEGQTDFIMIVSVWQ